MKYNFAERIVLIVSYLSLMGIPFSGLVAKGVLESGMEMCVPQAAVYFLTGTFASILIWSVLTLLLSISRRLREIESKEVD